MENGLVVDDSRSVKMGATSNPNSARLAALQERKKNIEDALAQRNMELKQLCIQEAELTGIMPSEIPLEPGESPPIFRRRVGTAYQLPQNLINSLNNKEESITQLELEKQVQANMAEAALGLANDPHISKTIRRQHKIQYNYHKEQYHLLEEKVMLLKSQSSKQQSPTLSQQQKHKKKPRPVEQEDTVSMGSEQFNKSVLRHSMRSLQYTSTSEPSEQRYDHQRLAYRNSDNSMVETNRIFLRNDDILMNGLYRLSINGYKNYMERHENTSNQYVQSSQGLTFTRPPQRSPVQVGYNYDYKYPGTSVRHLSPGTSGTSHLKMYYPSHTIHGQASYKQYPNVEQGYRTLNIHQIQPHQQYEQDVMNAGLGGYWKHMENGEAVWCNSALDDSWQREKRFGSLDRRKNKRLQKKTSPLVETKSATIAASTNVEQARIPPPKPAQIIARSRQDNRQLVRTQSLGSVGVQTVDGTWAGDENSSCESDTISIETSNARKLKQKEWYETSLDGPPTPTLPRSQSAIPPQETNANIFPFPPPPQLPPPPKLPLEIPAESNPAPRMPETNIELFNNNIPKNCTVVQAGVCKPYHEETKPFEMSDFYKYSTKFKKSPQKQEMEKGGSQASPRKLADSFDNAPPKPMKSPPFGALSNTSFGSMENTSNVSLDLNQSLANVAEKFSAEMNDWYQSQECSDKHSSRGSPSRNRSTATLV